MRGAKISHRKKKPTNETHKRSADSPNVPRVNLSIERAKSGSDLQKGIQQRSPQPSASPRQQHTDAFVVHLPPLPERPVFHSDEEIAHAAEAQQATLSPRTQNKQAALRNRLSPSTRRRLDTMSSMSAFPLSKLVGRTASDNAEEQERLAIERMVRERADEIQMLLSGGLSPRRAMEKHASLSKIASAAAASPPENPRTSRPAIDLRSENRWVTRSQSPPHTKKASEEMNSKDGPQALQRAKEISEWKRSLFRLDVLCSEIAHCKAVAQAREREERRVAEAGRGARRTANTILSEWRSYADAHPPTIESMLRSDSERMFRMQSRREKIEASRKRPQDVAAHAERVRAAVKRWRVPKGVVAEVFPQPRISASPVASVPAEATVTELEQKLVGGLVWIRTEDGWIATQYIFGGFSKVQLMPDAAAEIACVQDYMLDELDEIHEQMESLLQEAHVDKLKSAAEVQELTASAQLARQQLRDLPRSHYQFIRQTWDGMQKTGQYQRELMQKRKRRKSSSVVVLQGEGVDAPAEHTEVGVGGDDAVDGGEDYDEDDDEDVEEPETADAGC